MLYKQYEFAFELLNSMKVQHFFKLFKPVDSLSVRYPLYSLTIPGLRIPHALLQSGDIIAEIVLIQWIIHIPLQ